MRGGSATPFMVGGWDFLGGTGGDGLFDQGREGDCVPAGLWGFEWLPSGLTPCVTGCAAPGGKEGAEGVRLSRMGGGTCDGNGASDVISGRALGLTTVTQVSSVEALGLIVCECRRKSLSVRAETGWLTGWICWSYIGVFVGDCCCGKPPPLLRTGGGWCAARLAMEAERQNKGRSSYSLRPLQVTLRSACRWCGPDAESPSSTADASTVSGWRAIKYTASNRSHS
jgi:hypothetical protein